MSPGDVFVQLNSHNSLSRPGRSIIKGASSTVGPSLKTLTSKEDVSSFFNLNRPSNLSQIWHVFMDLILQRYEVGSATFCLIRLTVKSREIYRRIMKATIRNRTKEMRTQRVRALLPELWILGHH